MVCRNEDPINDDDPAIDGGMNIGESGREDTCTVASDRDTL